MKSSVASIKSREEIKIQFNSPEFNDADILNVLRKEAKTKDYLDTIKAISNSNDKTISNWLNINEKTLRNYKQAQAQVKDNIKEHIIYLLRVITLGNRVFGSNDDFDRWLNTPNFVFNNERPTDFVKTITGIRFVIDRLTAMEYGDNVWAMEIFRICAAVHAGALTSSGKANRWNSDGRWVIYAGSSRSLATLELMVHQSSISPQVPYRVMVISVADDDRLVRQIQPDQLPPDWRTLYAYPRLQSIGDAWYDHQETLILKVPSVIIPQESNFVINTEHPDYSSHVQRAGEEDYYFDQRLFHSKTKA
jgi:putative toxin-antitoxin system antitoxin component (TIGR02293 family)